MLCSTWLSKPYHLRIRLPADSAITGVTEGLNINLGGMLGNETKSETTLIISRSYMNNVKSGSAVLPDESARGTVGTVIQIGRASCRERVLLMV